VVVRNGGFQSPYCPALGFARRLEAGATLITASAPNVPLLQNRPLTAIAREAISSRAE